MVEAVVLANFAGPASREVLGALATLADRLDIGGERMGELGQAARLKLWLAIDSSTIRVGDVFAFGHYPQGANGEVQPIEWQVLRHDSDGLLVIAKYALDCKPYNEVKCDVTWSQCTLRKWLNGAFIEKAFTATERQQIRQVHLRNPNSRWDSNVPGGSDTDDRIFLLSHDEALLLFANDESRQCLATAYAKQNNAYTTNDDLCFWWLRSPGYSAPIAARVYSDGDIDYHFSYVYLAVRPAFKIAL